MLRYLSDYKRESVLAPLFKMLEATFCSIKEILPSEFIEK